ncbi:MAG TPA: DUF692 family protein [Puia sp.]|nr:DUF692 family protein [Puia sp.]
MKVLSSIACNLDTDLLSAAFPLLEEERVEAIEWSFDALFHVGQIPPWFWELLTAYSKGGRLIGHGIFFSLFSGKWLPGQDDWLRKLKQTSTDLPFDHITEHFGFMTGKDFHQGAPLNIPYSQLTLEIGRDRLKRIYEACRCPVGLENLAFSYSPEEVRKHGEFLERLIEPVNGFIILDLHNLYCQIRNFSIGFEELIALYPLDRVREIHLSGGSWEDSQIDAGRKVRRDTHDESVPREVFDYLEIALRQCPNLKYVVLEQLGTALTTAESRRFFYDDFLTMSGIVEAANGSARLPDGSSNRCNSFLPLCPITPGEIIEDEILYEQQLQLSGILETAASYEEALGLLRQSSLSHSDWEIESWEPAMLETAMKIAQKWREGWINGKGQ